MTTRNLMVALAIIFTVRPSLGQSTPVALVHGFHSGSATWTDFQNYLVADGRFTVPSPPTLSWGDSIAHQAVSELQPYLTSYSFGTNSILVGQSQGGLVSRRATRGFSVLGILTVGTPNYGAAIAGSGSTMSGYTDDIYYWDEQIFF